MSGSGCVTNPCAKHIQNEFKNKVSHDLKGKGTRYISTNTNF